MKRKAVRIALRRTGPGGMLGCECVSVVRWKTNKSKAKLWPGWVGSSPAGSSGHTHSDGVGCTLSTTHSRNHVWPHVHFLPLSLSLSLSPPADLSLQTHTGETPLLPTLCSPSEVRPLFFFSISFLSFVLFFLNFYKLSWGDFLHCSHAGRSKSPDG